MEPGIKMVYLYVTLNSNKLSGQEKPNCGLMFAGTATSGGAQHVEEASLHGASRTAWPGRTVHPWFHHRGGLRPGWYVSLCDD